MNEEYLWNKTGTDAEIENLENALRAFRYQETGPPKPPAKTFVLSEVPRRKVWRLGFAFAFAAAVVGILPTVWFLNTPTVDQSSVSTLPATDPEMADAPSIVKSVPLIQNEAPSSVKVRHVVSPAPKHLTASALHKKPSAVVLTPEEKYAYGQLMLALSITESKLKIVRDAFGGNEEIKTNIEKGRDLNQK